MLQDCLGHAARNFAANFAENMQENEFAASGRQDAGKWREETSCSLVSKWEVNPNYSLCIAGHLPKLRSELTGPQIGQNHIINTTWRNVLKREGIRQLSLYETSVFKTSGFI